MSDLVGNPEDRFSHNEAHFVSDRVFGHFEKPLFLELCKHMECKMVPAGGSLFKIGDEDNCIYVVQSGKINVFITEGVNDVDCVV